MPENTAHVLTLEERVEAIEGSLITIKNSVADLFKRITPEILGGTRPEPGFDPSRPGPSKGLEARVSNLEKLMEQLKGLVDGFEVDCF